MQSNTTREHKYVFVCGMARSGTSLLGRNIARLTDCSGFQNTGVFEDEGQFLQDVYAVASEYGGSSRCAFDPGAHRTETSELLTPENVARLHTSWHAHWDNSKTILVEKTPENLLMSRFLQAAFPNSYFVAMSRHPVPASIAGQKWRINFVPLHRMFAHWLRCHEIVAEDRPHLRRVYTLRYEDYIKDATKYHEEIAEFIGTTVPPQPKEDTLRNVVEWGNPAGRWVPNEAMEEATGAHNQKYFDRWRSFVNDSFFRMYYRYIARKYEPQFAPYGYSLICECGVDPSVLETDGWIYDTIGVVLCWGADVYALAVRVSVRPKEWLRVIAKAVLPSFVVDKIRRSRQSRPTAEAGKRNISIASS
jgi:hypothetical protein